MVITTGIALVIKYVLCKRENDRTAFLTKGLPKSLTSNTIANYKQNYNSKNVSIMNNEFTDPLVGAVIFTSQETKPAVKGASFKKKPNIIDNINKTNSLDVNSEHPESVYDTHSVENLHSNTNVIGDNKLLKTTKKKKKNISNLDHSDLQAFQNYDVREGPNDD